MSFGVRGALLLDGELVDGALVVDEGRIVEVVRGAGALPARVIDAPIVAPGFVEHQINGGFGVDVAEDAGAIAALAAALPATGVTSFLPTLVSTAAAAFPARLGALVERLAGSASGAVPLGLHLEGPFLAPDRAGAHDRGAIERADDRLIDAWIATGAVRLVTLAPERPGALARIRRLRDAGVVVALGHSAASHAEAIAGIDAGATLVTHLYNAMSPFAHREPGLVGAALTDARVALGLIADGIHAHPAALRLALRAKGAGGVALTTDAMAAAGRGPGTYGLAGRAVTVDVDSARLADGTLAGSILTMDRAVRNMVAFGGATPAEALTMASTTPARVLGLDRKGVLAVGADADLVLLDRDLSVRSAYRGTRSLV